MEKYYLMNNGSCRKLIKNETEYPEGVCEAVECILPGKHPHLVEYYFELRNRWIKITDANKKIIWKAKIFRKARKIKNK